MKKILYHLSIYLIVFSISSCSKLDNYDAPAETITGSVIDLTTGKSLQSEAGSGGIRIKLEELSWSDTPTPYYFYSMQDGTFNNTKIFKGKYKISVEGPFVPLVQYNSTGTVIVDNSKTVEVAGITKVEFQVEPFLKVEWIGEPVLNADKSVSVKIKFTRGTNHADYQLDVTDAYLFISPNPYIANNNFDNRYSTQVNYSGTSGTNLLGQTITITSKAPLPGSRTWYIRVGARIGFGLKQYNYNEPKLLTLP